MNFLFHSLLRWFMFGGTNFFAAGAAIDVTMGSESAGAEGVETTGAGAGAEGSESESEGSSGDGEDARVLEGQDKQDNRTLPKNIQSTLKTLRESHPEMAKELDELRKSYFASKQHSEFFKSPAEARQAKAALDLVGGHEGIANLQSKVAAIEQVDASFEQGDPQVIDDLVSDFPEGFKKLVPYSLDKLQKLDPEAYGKVILPHVMAQIEKHGLVPVLGSIQAAIAGGKPEEAKQLITQALSFYEQQKQQVGARPNVDDPERVKFENERKQFEQTREQSFRHDIGRETVAHQANEIRKVLGTYPNFKKLSDDAKNDLVEGVNLEVNRRLKADGTYQGQVKALLASKTRDPGKIVQYINAAVSDVVGKAAPAVHQRRYGSVAPVKPAQTGQQQQAKPVTQSGPVKLTAKPKREDVDWAKTKDILFITNKAYMKNGIHKGKLVTW